jgi:WD40 repeat protein
MMGYAGMGRTESNFAPGDTVTITVMLKTANLCGTAGNGGGGTMGTGGSTGTGGTGGSVGCTGVQPPAGTPPSLKCCTEYDHSLTSLACDSNDTYMYGVAFTPDGKLAVSGGDDGRYVFWNFDGKTLTPEGHNITGGAYGYAAFSPNSMLFAGGGGEVHLFTIPGLGDAGAMMIDYYSYGLAFTPDGQQVVDVDSDSLYVHAVSTNGQLTKTPLTHTAWALAVAPVAVGGALGIAIPSADGYATVYNLTGTSTLSTPTTLQASANGLWSAAFSPNGMQLALGGYDSYVDIFSLPLTATSAPVISFSVDEPALLEDVNGIAWSPDGRYVAVASGFNTGAVSIWEVATKTRIGRYALQDRYALSVAFAPSGNAVLVGEHGCGKILLCTE